MAILTLLLTKRLLIGETLYVQNAENEIVLRVFKPRSYIPSFIRRFLYRREARLAKNVATCFKKFGETHKPFVDTYFFVSLDRKTCQKLTKPDFLFPLLKNKQFVLFLMEELNKHIEKTQF